MTKNREAIGLIEIMQSVIDLAKENLSGRPIAFESFVEFVTAQHGRLEQIRQILLAEEK